MKDVSEIFTLPDHAIALFFALRELGPMDRMTLGARLGKSQASIFRSMAILRENGFLPQSRQIPLTYALTTKLAA